MIAMGEESLVEQIKKCFWADAPMPLALHDAAMLLYWQYLAVGGMPECVMQFAETKDYILIRHTQEMILASYLNDMSKYNNLNEIKKTRLAYDNITVQLSKKNTRKILGLKTGKRPFLSMLRFAFKTLRQPLKTGWKFWDGYVKLVNDLDV